MIVKVCNPQPMTLAPVLKESQKRDKSIPSSGTLLIIYLYYYSRKLVRSYYSYFLFSALTLARVCIP